jgi:hypothetical protein
MKATVARARRDDRRSKRMSAPPPKLSHQRRPADLDMQEW